MFNDFLMFLAGPILIAAVIGVAWVIDRYFGDCRHEWGKWERERDTECAVVQSRVCKKCLMHQIHQVRKMYNKEERNDAERTT